MSATGTMSVAIRIAGFTGVMVGLGLVSGGICYGLVGESGVEAAIWATAICLPPGWLVFLMEPLYRLPRQAVYGALVGSMIRLGLVTAGVLLVIRFRPEVSRPAFIGCLAVQYLGGLALETLMVMRGLPLRPQRSAESQAAVNDGLAIPPIEGDSA